MGKKVCVLGLGYIGLPTALLLSDAGHNVNGVDVNKQIVNSLNEMNLTINEPGLKKLFKKNFENKSLTITNEPSFADIFIICVPTPIKNRNNKKIADISYVNKAVKKLIPFLQKENTLIIESTIPVGTMEKISDFLILNNHTQVNLVYCPERVLPGNIIKELKYNNRILGIKDKNQSSDIYKFMKSYIKGSITITDFKTAELSKLTENAFRDVNIAFANEISMICDKEKIDVWELIKIVNMHPRVNVLQPGCGVGGHCIAVDPWFLIEKFSKSTKLIKQARLSNLEKTTWVENKILSCRKIFINKNKKEPIIGILGLTYKPNVSDTRESPALEITKNMFSKNLKLLVSDPYLKEQDKIKIYPTKIVITKADILVILVGHDEYKKIKFSKDKIILDFINNHS